MGEVQFITGCRLADSSAVLNRRNPCSLIPVPVTGLQHDVASLGVGVGFDYALMHSGKLLAWGDNFFGQLGWKTPKPPRLVHVPLPGRVVEVRAGLNVGLANRSAASLEYSFAGG